jgi:hypothetical protein
VYRDKQQCFFAIPHYYPRRKNDIKEGMKCLERALELSVRSEHTVVQCKVQKRLAEFTWQMGNYCVAQTHAREAQHLAKLPSDLYEEAAALQIEAMCCGASGDFKSSLSLLQTAARLLDLCGMPGAYLGFLIGLYIERTSWTSNRNVGSHVKYKVGCFAAFRWSRTYITM